MKMHILYRLPAHSHHMAPVIQPNDEIEQQTNKSYPFGIVLFDSTEEERKTVLIAYCESIDADNDDGYTWLMVAPV